MAEAGYSFKAIPECLYYYRDHREHYRLTTHVPLETQINELKKIWKKHGLKDNEIEEQIKRRISQYLKQALYMDEEDKRKKERIMISERAGERSTGKLIARKEAWFYLLEVTPARARQCCGSCVTSIPT